MSPPAKKITDGGGEGQLLLAAGADVHASDQFGNTSLMIAAFNGSAECVRILLAAGADVHAVDKDGRSALMLADSEDHQDCVELLRTDQSHGV